MANVKPISNGYHSVQPYLYFNGAAEAIDFYTKVFGATERMCMAQRTEVSATPRFKLATPA